MLESFTDFLLFRQVLDQLARTIEAGATKESDEAQGVTHVGDYLPEYEAKLPELIKIVRVLLKLAQLFNLFVKLQCSFVRVKARVLLCFSKVLEPFLLFGEQVFDVLVVKQLAEDLHFST